MATFFDLFDFDYAHRGLWTPNGAAENSLSAFGNAAHAGLGIEFDVRPSADGEIMVFHDPALARMTGGEGAFDARTASELSNFLLNGTADHVPTFDELLALWPQDLPLLTEMKIDGATDPVVFARTVGARLAAWDGLAAAMSFSEAAVRALPQSMMRGQLIYPSERTDHDAFQGVCTRAIKDGIDYLAVHHSDLDRIVDCPLPVVTWTVRTQDELSRARKHCAAIIFERLTPREVLDSGA